MGFHKVLIDNTVLFKKNQKVYFAGMATSHFSSTNKLELLKKGIK